MKIRDLPVLKTHADIARTLAGLSPALLKLAVEESSQAMDVLSLRTMTEGGMLDIEDVEREFQLPRRATMVYGRFSGKSQATPPFDSVHRRFEVWCERLIAFCAFAKNVAMVPRETTLVDLRSTHYSIPVLEASPDFKIWFREATDALATAWSQATIDMPDSMAKTKGVSGIAHWMACAVMLDLPEALLTLHAVCPEAIASTFSLAPLVGKHATSRLMEVDDNGVDVSLPWLAWQFSSNGCLDALATHTQTIDGDAAIAYDFRDPASTWATLKGAVSLKDKLPVTLLQCLVTEGFGLRCDNATFVRAIGVAVKTEASRDAMADVALALLRSQGLSSLSVTAYRIDAYWQAGVYALHPITTAQAACVAGFPSMIETMVPAIDMERLSAQTIYDALEQHTPGADFRAEAVQTLVLSVKNHHGLDAARQLFWGKRRLGDRNWCPFRHVLTKNLEKLLVTLLDEDIVEPLVTTSDRDTPLQFAKDLRSPLDGVMLSWMARRNAQALIEEMNPQPPAQAMQ